MRSLKTLIIVASALVMSAGSVLLAADDPLEIHGGGRVGWVVNSKLGSQQYGEADNSAGTMPNYAETRYLGIYIGKKTTSEGGAWAKTNVYIDKWAPDADGDLEDQDWRFRDFHLDFGGLDFLPAGATLWAGLKGYSAGWNGQQDHAFINFSGIGIGIGNIGGVFSLSYMSQDNVEDNDGDATAPVTGDANVLGIGERVMHNIIAQVSVPMADVFGAIGYSKKGKDAGEKNLTNIYGGAIVKPGVMGLNIGVAFSTNGYAKEIYSGNSDTCLKGNHLSGVAADKTNKYTGVALAAWTVTDLAPGLYTATSIRYDMLQAGKETSEGVAAGNKNTLNKLGLSVRISKALTKNIAFCPTLGYYREWDKEKFVNPKPLSVIQATAAVEMGLDTGYWAGQKVQVYATYTKRDSDHKYSGGAFDGKTSATTLGCLVTFGW